MLPPVNRILSFLLRHGRESVNVCIGVFSVPTLDAVSPHLVVLPEPRIKVQLKLLIDVGSLLSKHEKRTERRLSCASLPIVGESCSLRYFFQRLDSSLTSVRDAMTKRPAAMIVAVIEHS
jgi:hypothetical protein